MGYPRSVVKDEVVKNINYLLTVVISKEIYTWQLIYPILLLALLHSAADIV